MGDQTNTVRPYGSRACAWTLFHAKPRPDNYWDSVPEYNERQYSQVMLDTEAKVPRSVMVKASGDYADLIDKARSGRATFGRGHRYDVDSLDSTEDVLELKWESLPPNYDTSPYVGLRLYFAEPISKPSLLLKLKLVCKIDDTAQQTSDALDSQDLFTRWNNGRRKNNEK